MNIPCIRKYQCGICQEIIKEDWCEGINHNHFITATNRMIHLFNHYYKEVIDKDENITGGLNDHK